MKAGNANSCEALEWCYMSSQKRKGDRKKKTSGERQVEKEKKIG